MTSSAFQRTLPTEKLEELWGMDARERLFHGLKNQHTLAMKRSSAEEGGGRGRRKKE